MRSYLSIVKEITNIENQKMSCYESIAHILFNKQGNDSLTREEIIKIEKLKSKRAILEVKLDKLYAKINP